MTMIAVTAPMPEGAVDREVSLTRLYVLRATYLLLIVGLGSFIVPQLLSHEPLARGVIPSLLGAVWLLAFIGLRYPLQMLPLLMFEFAWKTVWLLDFGLSNGRRVTRPPRFARIQDHRRRRDPDADRHRMGLCAAAFRPAARRAVVVNCATCSKHCPE